jgi:SRSO17 transposase
VARSTTTSESKSGSRSRHRRVRLSRRVVGLVAGRSEPGSQPVLHGNAEAGVGQLAQNVSTSAAAGVPADIEFATKPELAARMILRALDNGVAAGWVAADEVYGGNQTLRSELEQRSKRSAVCAMASNLKELRQSQESVAAMTSAAR